MTETDLRPRITVLHALGKPDGTTRYVDHMIDSAPEELKVETFSWTEALFGRYDVFHIHWPENLLRGRRRGAGALKKLMFLMLVARLRITGRPIVRTVHNLDPHEDGGAAEGALLSLCDSVTNGFVRLNTTTQLPEGRSSTTIPHGHYKDRPEYQCSVPQDPTRLLYFGLIRPYKGVDDLLQAFAELESDDLSLRVVGKPQDAGLAAQIHQATESDNNISCRLEFLPDTDLGEEIAQAMLVVLPYREMHNSGSTILALSMARPVLVPSTPVNRALKDEVGPGWVYLYDSPALDSETLRRILHEVDTDRLTRSGEPNLSDRDWGTVGERHYALYRELLTAGGSKSRARV
ncbi:glycosyltransferase [Rhodococcus sp. AG1013]|uniref:glycosyltransferase n=1 Tax=unclassified Rhodococcus (in: high G+C Gram-positive bacteria) TaxID=192944 RepID=UPI000E0AF982|nr:glycosyltransferase [Rhodococcus sp. AG1013]RDI26792.1 beta-1,4-mannosyltransferase [Rhodococcus sp. AG1013]